MDQLAFALAFLFAALILGMLGFAFYWLSKQAHKDAVKELWDENYKSMPPRPPH